MNFADLPEGWDKIFSPLKVGDQVFAELGEYSVEGKLVNMDFGGFYVVDGTRVYSDKVVKDSAILVPVNKLNKR